MAKQVVIYNPDNEWEIETQLVGNSVSHQKIELQKSDMVLDAKTNQPSLLATKELMKKTSADIALVCVEDIVLDTLRVGDSQQMLKRSVESLIDVLADIPWIVKTVQ